MRKARGSGSVQKFRPVGKDLRRGPEREKGPYSTYQEKTTGKKEGQR